MNEEKPSSLVLFSVVQDITVLIFYITRFLFENHYSHSPVMSISKDALKLLAIGLVLLAASQICGVYGAALNQYVTGCGYRYEQCHEGYERVKNAECKILKPKIATYIK